MAGLPAAAGTEDATRAPIRFDGLEAKPSLLGPQAGFGLFTTREFQVGDVVCEYRGRCLPSKEALKLTDKSYLMRLGESTYVDAREDLSVAARYINDCRLPALHNVRFDKKPAEGRALVVATRNILEGEELFVDYGRLYWASGRPSKLPVSVAAPLLKRLEEAGAGVGNEAGVGTGAGTGGTGIPAGTGSGAGNPPGTGTGAGAGIEPATCLDSSKDGGSDAQGERVGEELEEEGANSAKVLAAIQTADG